MPYISGFLLIPSIDLETTKNEVANEVAKLAIPKIQKEDMIAYRRSIREAKLAGKFINNLEDIKRGTPLEFGMVGKNNE